jgi:hypothetical protein
MPALMGVALSASEIPIKANLLTSQYHSNISWAVNACSRLLQLYDGLKVQLSISDVGCHYEGCLMDIVQLSCLVDMGKPRPYCSIMRTSTVFIDAIILVVRACYPNPTPVHTQKKLACCIMQLQRLLGQKIPLQSRFFQIDKDVLTRLHSSICQITNQEDVFLSLDVDLRVSNTLLQSTIVLTMPSLAWACGWYHRIQKWNYNIMSGRIWKE